MDHNIPDVIRAIYLDFAFRTRRLISRGIISERALFYDPVAVTRVNSLETLKAREHGSAVDSKASPANEL